MTARIYSNRPIALHAKETTQCCSGFFGDEEVCYILPYKKTLLEIVFVQPRPEPSRTQVSTEDTSGTDAVPRNLSLETQRR
ncbi:unnamed protein product [Mucor hiemalis]